VEAGVPTPEFFAFSELAFRELGAAEALPQIEERLTFPIVVKPAAQGSALGIKFARTADDVPAALVNAFSYDDKVLLECHIDGRELAVSMIEQDGAPLALPVVEAVPRDEDFFDFEARYEIGRTEYRCPPELSDDEIAAVSEVARATWAVLGCAGFARADIMLPAGDEPQVLEVNATPGLTETSLLPMACDAAGLGFDQFVERTLELALDRVGASTA
jgi:D-alanine-D-alanine ligase